MDEAERRGPCSIRASLWGNALLPHPRKDAARTRAAELSRGGRGGGSGGGGAGGAASREGGKQSAARHVAKWSEGKDFAALIRSLELAFAASPPPGVLDAVALLAPDGGGGGHGGAR